MKGGIEGERTGIQSEVPCHCIHSPPEDEGKRTLMPADGFGAERSGCMNVNHDLICSRTTERRKRKEKDRRRV